MGTTVNNNFKYPDLNSYFHLSQCFKSNSEILKILITNKNIKNKEDIFNTPNNKDLNDFDDMF